MANVTVIQRYGEQLLVQFDDGTRKLAYPANGLWIVSSGTSGPQPGNGLINPWKDYPVTGTWEDHSTYSFGGTDYPLAYGTDIIAPASGTIVGQGWVGSAGRVTDLILDTPVERHTPPSPILMNGSYVEAQGPMVRIRFQHLAEWGNNGHVNQGDLFGCKSGASADGVDYGGDIHLHVHGYDANDNRLDWVKFAP